MLLDLNIIKTFYPRSHDLDKPNFIFSSDIPDKVKKVVSKYLNDDEEIIDLSNDLEFNVNVELNSLLLRNKDLKPSDLIKENLVYLARTSSKKLSKNIESLIRSNNGIKIQPYRFIADEIFIVSLSLRILDFIVNKKLNQIIIDFLKDESYGILLLCDEQLIDQIENYVKVKFINELNRHLSSPISEESRDSTMIEGIPMVSDDILVNETTLEMSGNEPMDEKSFMYVDEYESSLEDLLLLKSNDTTRSTNDEDEEILLDNVLNDSIKSEKPIKATYEDGFIKDINNLRHNETFIKLDDLNETECKPDEQDDIPVSPGKMPLAKNQPKLKPPVHIKSSMDYIPTLSSDTTMQSSASPFSSPTKNRSLSAKASTASFSMIHHEDNNGLEYAFKDRSPTVPTYIKQDKKFKFIKVGKVQKFVNLFEEKMSEGTSDNKVNTRPASPSKKESLH